MLILLVVMVVSKVVDLLATESRSSVRSVEDLRKGGRWLNHPLGQYSFRGLMMVIATGFIPLPRYLLFLQGLCKKASSGLERILCRVMVKITPGKHR